MEKPDPYADWVLFQTREGEFPASFALDEGLLSAARAAWPGALAHANKQFSAARLGSDGAAFAVQVWEQLLRSVSKARQRKRDQRPRFRTKDRGEAILRCECSDHFAGASCMLVHKNDDSPVKARVRCAQNRTDGPKISHTT